MQDRALVGMACGITRTARNARDPTARTVLKVDAPLNIGLARIDCLHVIQSCVQESVVHFIGGCRSLGRFLLFFRRIQSAALSDLLIVENPSG